MLWPEEVLQSEFAMMPEDNNYAAPKISYEFESRLKLLDPRQKVRAIVLLQTENADLPSTRPSRADRQKVISAIRQTAEAALPEIDEILERFEGTRLGHSINALGSITVEAPAKGIRALAASAQVKAVLEDQPISLPAKLKRA